MYKTLLVDESAGVLTVTLNRPEVHNAFNDRSRRRCGSPSECGAVNRASPTTPAHARGRPRRKGSAKSRRTEWRAAGGARFRGSPPAMRIAVRRQCRRAQSRRRCLAPTSGRRRLRKSHSGGRRFDPDQLHQSCFPPGAIQLMTSRRTSGCHARISDSPRISRRQLPSFQALTSSDRRTVQ